MSTAKTHPCPGGCGAQVPADKLACPLDWARLPRDRKEEVLAAWRTRHTDRMGHLRAVARAVSWFRHNPRKHILGRNETPAHSRQAPTNKHERLYRNFRTPDEGAGQ